MATRQFAAALLLTLVAASAHATSFIVRNDRDFFNSATTVAIGSALSSYTRMTDSGAVETVTVFSIEDVIKGDVSSGEMVDLVEPGGVFQNKFTIMPGSPRFEDGNRYLLFLFSDADGWHAHDLILGKFSFATDLDGRKLLVRDADEIVGWDPDGTVHKEPHRSETRFLAFLRSLARGDSPARDYFLPKEPIAELNPVVQKLSNVAPMSASLTPKIDIAPFTVNSYLMDFGSGVGPRWNIFPSPVTFFSIGTEPGAPGGGITAITNAFAAWNNDASSNVNYVYGGADVTGTHNGGISTPDGQNSIAFEQNIPGVQPFVCTANSFGGTLGKGGVTTTTGNHIGPNGESFWTTGEGDVAMNVGIANCALLFNNGDFDSAVAHEVGHTLGFRHSDQTRNFAAACNTDPNLECADVAIMKSFIPLGLHAALQVYDQHAVQAVYPGTVVVAPGPPTGVNARATSATTVLITWNPSSGATSYDIYRMSSLAAGFVKTGSTSATSFTDTAPSNQSFLYMVRAVNAGGASTDSGSDIATTIIFVDDPLTAGTPIKVVHLAQARQAVNAARVLADLAPAPWTDNAAPGLRVRAIHLSEMRTRLDEALSRLGRPTGGYTDAPGPAFPIKAIHFQEIRNRVK